MNLDTKLNFKLFIIFIGVITIKQIETHKTIKEVSECEEFIPEITEIFLNYEDRLFSELGRLTEKGKINEKKVKVQDCPDGFVCIRRKPRERGKYLGCYEDHMDQRMFRGYAVRLIERLTVDWCIKTCHSHRFIYAGLQLGTDCLCGNMAPQPQLNRLLTDDKCDISCPGNAIENCGGTGTMDVYQTGIEQYIQDSDGLLLEESNSYSEHKWVMTVDC